MDNVASQSSKLLVNWEWARGSCLAQIWAGWESFVQIRTPGLEPSAELPASIGSLTFQLDLLPAPASSLAHLAADEWGPEGGPGLRNPPRYTPGY